MTVRLKVALAAALLAGPSLAAAALRPAYGGELRVVVPSPPRDGDPARAIDVADVLLARATSAPLLEVDAAGALSPGVLAEVPVAEAGGRAFRLRVAPGVRTVSGAPVGAADVAAALARLVSHDARSPHAWAALPVLGADAVLDGRATALAGVQVLSDTELLLTLAFPLPELPHLLAALPLAIRGAGPFVAPPRATGAGPVVLRANENAAAGRPFANALTIAAADARGAARLLERGAADLVLRPEAAGGLAGPASPALLVTVAAVNGARLGVAADGVRRALAAVDRGELARRFVRGPAEPLQSIVPVSAWPGGAAPAARGVLARGDAAPRATGAPPLRLLVHSAAPDQRALAERLQVKLFDAGTRAAVDLADPARFAARLAAGDYDVALVPVPILAARPALAAAQVAFAVRGAAPARRAMTALAGLAPEPAAKALAALERDLDVVPLVASGLRASAAPALQGLEAAGVAADDPGDLWLVGGGAR